MAKKTVAEKMYIKPGMKLGFFNAPDNLRQLLGGLPEKSEIHHGTDTGNLDFMLAFIEDRMMMEKKLEVLKKQIKDDGALWLAYHKGSSAVDTDINRDSIHKYGKRMNLKGVAMVSINEDWSGFRFKKV